MTTVKLLGMSGIARTLGVARATVDSWKKRGHLPPEDFQVDGHGAWYPKTIKQWDKKGRPS